jgi:transcriptional regulator
MFRTVLKKGSMELLVLSFLTDQHRHGYEIGKLIEKQSGGKLRFRISSLYPVLCRMEKRGWIKGRWVEKTGAHRRRYYHLTSRGEAILTEQREYWEEFTAAVNTILDANNA